MKKILIIEDEIDIAELLCTYLQESGYEVYAVHNGINALTEFDKTKWDLVLLDLLLPGLSGYKVCERIREKSNVPIIMLTALESEGNQIKGYELKIDDYITKPFSMPILLHKINAVLRRYNGLEQKHTICYKDLVLDFEEYEITVDGKKVELTTREFDIMRELLEHQGRVYTREILLSKLWEYDFFGDERIVDTHIKNLRKKISRDYIETVRGVGYRVSKID